MEYLLVAIMFVVLIGLVVAILVHSRPPTGTLDGKPHVRSKPSADESTPDASVTASQKQVNEARHHTPPA